LDVYFLWILPFAPARRFRLLLVKPSLVQRKSHEAIFLVGFSSILYFHLVFALHTAGLPYQRFRSYFQRKKQIFTPFFRRQYKIHEWVRRC
jgi:hypothetical protein